MPPFQMSAPESVEQGPHTVEVKAFDVQGTPASDAEYQQRETEIAHQVIVDLHAPDVIAVAEAEDQDICTVQSWTLVCGTTNNADGKPDVLQELAIHIHQLGGPDYDPSDFGIGSAGGGSNPGAGNGGDPDSSNGGGNQGIPGDALESEPSLDPGTDPLETFAQSAATPLAELPSQDSPLPDTFVFLAAVGLLAAGLGAGFVWFRRRQL